jgi:hypothetical protein
VFARPIDDKTGISWVLIEIFGLINGLKYFFDSKLRRVDEILRKGSVDFFEGVQGLDKFSLPMCWT